MAQATADPTTRYETEFRALAEARKDEPAWLHGLREKAFAKFQHAGFPIGDKRDEAWKYTDVKPIAQGDFRLPLNLTGADIDIGRLFPFDEGMIRLAFVDGHFAPHLSQGLGEEGLIAMPLTQALREHEDLVRDHFTKYAELEHDAFVPLNSAMQWDGAFIYAQQALQTPVHLAFITSDYPDPVVTFPRSLVVAAPLSELVFIETYVSLGERNHFTDAVCEIAVEDGAKVTHYRLLLENQQSYQVGHVRPYVGRDASYHSLVFEAGSGLGRLDLEVVMSEEGAHSQLHGLYVTAGSQHIDNLVSIDHTKPHGTSRLYYKGILDDQSSAAFGGTVFVRRGADKTDAHQEDKNLLLSNKAQVNSKPALEIYADDVKAGHGATAGAPTDDVIFYLQSRGLDFDTAMNFLVKGFAGEILDEVKIEALREYLEAITLRALPRFRSEVTV